MHLKTVFNNTRLCITAALLLVFALCFDTAYAFQSPQPPSPRTRICINEGWKFMRYEGEPDSLRYDERPKVYNRNDDVVADTRASQLAAINSSDKVLKKWILPTANEFINNPQQQYIRPAGNPGHNFPFVQSGFNDKAWKSVDLPHDWAIDGPFYKELNAVVGGGMGRLPVQGVAWYRKKLAIPASAKGKTIYLDIDGAMSYAMVWLNGHLVGGWPNGYSSFRLNLTPYINPKGDNQLAIRLDNPPNSSRWYPGAGIYRNVWLTMVNPVHIAQWGTFVRTTNVSQASANVEFDVQVKNLSNKTQSTKVSTAIYQLNTQTNKAGKLAAIMPVKTVVIEPDKTAKLTNVTAISNPVLWEPLPQAPSLYVAVTQVFVNGIKVDEYKTPFGIRTVAFDPIKGLLVNGKSIRIKGVNQHHDLGALGGAFNTRAAQRQLQVLKEMGCNAIRLAHNSPAPELLDLTDKMGFLVIDEMFDCWERGKTPLDFHLIFKDWHEPDLRSFIRRDRNHPSIIAWSFGNEVGEQYTAEAGATVARKLYDIVKQEDATRPATASMNYAKPDMPFPQVMDILSLNYQGEGIRDAPAYLGLSGIRTNPLYPAFQQKFPTKAIFSSETASTLSSRATYVFPVTALSSAPVSDTSGGEPNARMVSAYDLYTAQFGASPDKVFATQDKHPYVAGEFVWSGWDYLGEPTPYYTARSSYSGIVDLAGFKKDRFYLYQSRWLPQKPMAHILPHWTWPNRVGKITPVHVYSSGDEAELFLNKKSLGRKKRGVYEYRFRWDSVAYQPGELYVVTYKNGKLWATDTVRTAQAPAKLQATADRNTITADGYDLCFITVQLTDSKGITVPGFDTTVKFEVSGPGQIVATDNGDPADLTSFKSHERKVYGGLALVIIKTKRGQPGLITVKAIAENLAGASLSINSRNANIR